VLTARDATAGLELPRNRSGVLVGMGCEGPVTGWGLRWRMAEHLGVDDPALRQAAAPALRAEHVVGTMPNIPANRISVQLDAAGPGFTLSAEELSGLRALEVAMDRLAAGDLDVVVVGAVDLAEEPRRVAALHALGAHGPAADAVVVLVLQRLADARAQARPILGVIGEEGSPAPSFLMPEALGNAGAADGLLRVALALLSPAGSRWEVQSRSLGGAEARVQVRVLQPPAASPALELPLLLSGHALGEQLPPLQRQRMAPAPALPLILGPLPRPTRPSLPSPSPVASAPVASAPVAAAPVAPPVVVAPMVPAPEPAPPSPVYVEPSAEEVSFPDSQPALEEEWAEPEQSMDPLLAMLEQRSQDLAEVHRRFLEQQSNVHQRFLQAQAQISRHLGVGLSLWAHAPEAGASDEVWQVEDAVTHDTWVDVSENTAAIPAYAPVAAPALATPVAPTVPTPAIPAAKAPTPDTLAPAVATRAPGTATAPSRGTKNRWACEPPADPAGLPGPRLSRADLVRISHEPIENVLGPTFAFQTPYAIVVRMPEPPLLLADRVTGIQGPACVQGKGTIWTETDVTGDAWYLEDGHMPPGILIETGQADLLLASWQGVDALNKGERAYRLLGCELVYRRSMPAPGDTLRYAIHIDGHAKLGGIRMFFFHYDCHVGEQLQIQVREGQAGFFTVQELGESGGCLWTPEEHKLDRSLPLATGPAVSQRRSFDRAQLDAAADGRGFDAFGPGFERCLSHSWGPRIGKLKLLDRVVSFDPKGGPWGRGYLKAELDIQPDLWFFNGHFNNDPCMPGTLMFDGCIQAMQLYLLAMGFGMENDGWRIEPVKDLPFKLICRGQVIPSSKRLDYELFVEGVWDGPQPKLRAQVLCTVDGLKCFHADPLEVELVPDWAMRRLAKLDDYVEPKPCEWDYASLIACAWGKPSDAFGPPYAVFDSARRCARLPAPPYHFISRVLKTTGGQANFKSGATVLVEYDAPASEWYFEQAGGAMPYAVLLEAGLQPCGWLASFVGSALQIDSDMLFRNLDGSGRLHAEVLPTSGTIRTRVLIKNINRSGGMIIEGFTVKMTLLRQEGGQEVEDPLYDFDTVFGFFPPASFANQVGMPPSDEERALLAVRAGEPIDLRPRPARYFSGRDESGNPAPKLPSGMLLMIDRAVSHEPAGGKAGLGRWIVEKDVDPSHWYFKAHFYTDPVQPGSLGIEAMVQSLQLHMIHRGYGKGMKFPRFQGLATGKDVWWRYRGQVVPKDKVVTVELDITAEEADCVIADAWLWVDGRRIYQAKGLAMRVVEGEPPTAPVVQTTEPKESAAPLLLRGAELLQKLSLPVPADHCPTWVLPALPMATMAMLALQFSGSGALKEGHALRWLSFPDGPREVEVYRQQERIVLAAEGQPFFWAAPADSSEVPACPALEGGMEDASPGALLYSTGRLFHGPRFHVLRQ
ncbi:MAG TPA: beta-ketoacyl synthase N-terminal-like domain-containing protein, partial [Myxococcota bacterium]|nr:beta-ketoacyl synthase N-terminal-like domain-containing protein [Myxococcota bacterium]